MAIELTPQQKTAVENRGGNLLVSAAAGSGKTKVLVDRLMGYLCDSNNPANIDDFLIITYTSAAAAELRGKIGEKLSEKIAQNPNNKHLRQQLQRLYLAQISTVHAFCSATLKQHAYQADIPADFRIAEEEEVNQIKHQVLEEILNDAYDNPDEDFIAFADSQEYGRSDDNLAELILSVYNSAICHKSPDKWLDACLEAMQLEGVTDVAQTKWAEALLRDTKSFAILQLDAMQKCVDGLIDVEAAEGPAQVFADTISWLKEISQCSTWDEIYALKSHDYGRLTFKKAFGDEALKEKLKAVRSACKESMTARLAQFYAPGEQVIADLQSAYRGARALVSLVRRFMDAFARRKRNVHIMDYSDLEHKMIDLLLGRGRTTPTVLSGEIAQRYVEIMVDEYQDSNQVQDAIFDVLTRKKHNCFMVGDVKQSIYQFRLADPDIFLEKYNRYPFAEEAKEGEGRKVLLSRNFRSAPGVIEAVNHVFSTCMSTQLGGLEYGDDEKLYQGKEYTQISEPEVSLYGIEVQSDTYAEEAAFVAEQILSLTDGTHMVRDGESLRPITVDDIVILLRSPGSVASEFLLALEERGIRCSTGNGTDLLQTEEIACLRAFLQAIHNPQLDIPLLAVLTSRVIGFKADDLAQIRIGNRYISLYDALLRSQLPKAVEFIEKWKHLRSFSRISGLSQLVTEIFSCTGFDTIFASDKNGAQRMENLQLFCKCIATYEKNGQRTLDQLLDYLDSMENSGMVSKDGNRTSGAVTIMSIHKSKGLEFPVVFLCGLSRGFNDESIRKQVLCHKELGLGLSCMDSVNRFRYPTVAKTAISNRILAEGISEEMRILYVAMTRPKDRLIMTYAAKNLEKKLSDIVNRMDYTNPLALTLEASCPGDWVLYAALHRSEAGAFFKLGGYPACSAVTEQPWHIAIAAAQTEVAAVPDENTPIQVPIELVKTLSKSLNFRYPHQKATQLPSKLTATQLKGRALDREVAQDTQQSVDTKYSWRRQSNKNLSGAEYGTAMHAVMQYIQYSCCNDEASVQNELNRLVEQGYIPQSQRDCIDVQSIVAFFASEIGRRVIACKEVVREFKFSILQDASMYYNDVQGEQVLLQGVVDLALIEDDAITVVDFKTDSLSRNTPQALAESYAPQVKSYAAALERIYEKPVKQAVLYFFRGNEFVSVI